MSSQARPVSRFAFRRATPLLLAALLNALPAHADDDAAAAPPAAPSVVRVDAVYAVLSSETSSANSCHQELVSEHELALREQAQQPWALRYAKPLSAAGLGLTSAVFYKKHIEDAVNPRWHRWKIPFVAANAVQGYMLGPGGAIGAWAGAEIGLALSSDNLLVALAGDIAGTLLGAALWNFFFPQVAALAAPATDPDGDIPIERFLTQSVCGETPQRRYDAPHYRVLFTLDGVQHYADLAYDPGEALAIAADGTIIGPSRAPLDE